MKTILFLALIILLASAKSKSHNGIKTPRPADDVNPQWSCKYFTSVNYDAESEGATSDKCSYLEYLKTRFQLKFTIPPFPQCFAQLDGLCKDEVVDYYEKVNIRKFAIELEIICQAGGQWEDVKAALENFQEKFEDAFTTSYWECIGRHIDTFVEQEYEPFPVWPAPFLDLLNYVCQGIIGTLKNTHRQAFAAFFEDQDNFKSLPAAGRDLWDHISGLIKDVDGIPVELTQCLITEIEYFRQSTIPEVEGTLNLYDEKGNEFEDEVAFMSLYESDIQSEIAIPGEPFDDMFDYQCWNYYAPKQHYKANLNGVNEDLFDGNRGHPLCPENFMYQPMSAYGPICCPINEDSSSRPYTYDCCQKSMDQPQEDRRGRKMSRRKQCSGCVCLQGYAMETKGDYWDQGDELGACVKYEKDDDE